MSNQLTIIISGKKGSGKSSVAKSIACGWMNYQNKFDRFKVVDEGNSTVVYDNSENQYLELDFPSEQTQNFWNAYNFKIYSFADPLKEICRAVLGCSTEQCYGDNNDKNTKTHIRWESMFQEIREKHERPRRGTGGIKPASGRMTARELMQVIGTDIFRQLDPNCWARATIDKIQQEGYQLALVPDARFPCEITIGTEIGGKSIRLDRNPYNDDHESEVALDDFPLGEFDLFVENSNVTMEDCHQYILKQANRWLKDRKLI